MAWAAVAAAVAIAGCGGSGGGNSEKTSTPAGGGGGGGGETVKIAADPSGALKFTKSTLKAKAGTVTFDFDNPSSTPHAFNVEGNGIEEKGTKIVTGGKATVTVDLKPGKYEFYCPVDSHRQQGMEGTLTVG